MTLFQINYKICLKRAQNRNSQHISNKNITFYHSPNNLHKQCLSRSWHFPCLVLDSIGLVWPGDANFACILKQFLLNKGEQNIKIWHGFRILHLLAPLINPNKQIFQHKFKKKLWLLVCDPFSSYPNLHPVNMLNINWASKRPLEHLWDCSPVMSQVTAPWGRLRQEEEEEVDRHWFFPQYNQAISGFYFSDTNWFHWLKNTFS